MKISCSVSNRASRRIDSISRPKITGICRVAFHTGDLGRSTRFFTEFLGYDRVSVLRDGSDRTESVTVRINERQSVELLPAGSDDPFRLVSFTIETEDSAALRRYLESKGCRVFEPEIRSGCFLPDFCVAAPGGVVCGVVQRGRQSAAERKLGDSRIARRMSHVGFMTPDPDAALSFYVDLLGFREVWRGGPDPAKVSWVHLLLPEGEETIELMLFEKWPTRPEMGHMNHLCLEVPDVGAARDRLRVRSLPAGCPLPSAISVGINRKRQVNYYDVDGTRVEIMEDHTIDGLDAPSSTGMLMKFRGRERVPQRY